MLKKIMVLIMVMCLACASADAKPKSVNVKSENAKPTASERIGNEAADAVADILTGSSSTEKTVTKTKSKGTPPGLAKKGKTPPGWSKGKKTGWGDKEVTVEEKKDSPIRSFVKKLFNKATQPEA